MPSISAFKIPCTVVGQLEPKNENQAVQLSELGVTVLKKLFNITGGFLSC